MVRKGGFEPPRLSAPPPQDGVSASSTTSALQSIVSRPFEGNRSLLHRRAHFIGRRCFLRLYTRSNAGVQVRGGTGHMARGPHLRAARDAFIVRCAHRLAPL